jgi:hypothetical protein
MASSPTRQFTGCLQKGLLSQVAIGKLPRRACAKGAHRSRRVRPGRQGPKERPAG